MLWLFFVILCDKFSSSEISWCQKQNDLTLNAAVDQHLHWLSLTYLLNIMSMRPRGKKLLDYEGSTVSDRAKSPRFILSNLFESKDVMKRWQWRVKSDNLSWDEPAGSTQSLRFVSVSINGCLFLSPPVVWSSCRIHEILLCRLWCSVVWSNWCCHLCISQNMHCTAQLHVSYIQNHWGNKHESLLKREKKSLKRFCSKNLFLFSRKVQFCAHCTLCCLITCIIVTLSIHLHLLHTAWAVLKNFWSFW